VLDKDVVVKGLLLVFRQVYCVDVPHYNIQQTVYNRINCENVQLLTISLIRRENTGTK
jgi:hypothetical protein